MLPSVAAAGRQLYQYADDGEEDDKSEGMEADDEYEDDFM
jgi:hypothetical protein